MVNDNQSREGSSRQQSAERAQTGSTTSQQGGTTGQRDAAQAGSGQYEPGSSSQGRGSYGQGAGQGAQGQQDAYGQGGYGQRSQRASTSQGGRQGQPGGALQRRGTGSLPYASDYAWGYGGGPFSIMRRISDEMDRLFENFGMGRALTPDEQGTWGQADYRSQSMPSIWSPHIDVRERNGKLLIQADLPGMKRDDIKVRIEDDTIVIEGERNQEQTTDQGGYYRSERSYGRFYRTIQLPEGANAESATASFRDGVLEVELDAPKQQQQRGRTLEVRDGGTSGTQAGSGSTSAGSSTYGNERAGDTDRRGSQE